MRSPEKRSPGAGGRTGAGGVNRKTNYNFINNQLPQESQAVSWSLLLEVLHV
jgi:hypothetical protein